MGSLTVEMKILQSCPYDELTSKSLSQNLSLKIVTTTTSTEPKLHNKLLLWYRCYDLLHSNLIQDNATQLVYLRVFNKIIITQNKLAYWFFQEVMWQSSFSPIR